MDHTREGLASKLHNIGNRNIGNVYLQLLDRDRDGIGTRKKYHLFPRPHFVFTILLSVVPVGLARKVPLSTHLEKNAR